MTADDEKRREIQLLLLREGYSQDEARNDAAKLPPDKLDEFLNLIRRYRAVRLLVPEIAWRPM